ncbi:ABC transporter permease [Streptomyces blattellae]|uniref:ABC transporter permease n=1 Tax=Streptomyces blattellae TaxID=2569855 RepID=UPI0012B8D053|nr:ABC transporter permease [Streptomyces blattellae]
MSPEAGMTAVAEPSAVAEMGERPAVKRARRQWGLTDVLAMSWLALLVFGMLFLPTLLNIDADTMSPADRLTGPSAHHWLGTDNYGRDLLARALAGARISLWIGFGSVAASALVGVPIGMLAGYLGGWLDRITSFVVDVVLAFPGLVLALALASFLGQSITNVMIAIAVPMCPVFVRLAKAQTLSVARREYVEASQVIGTPARSILRRDVLPNITEAMLAFALVSVGHAILIEGGLSFLGMGMPPTVTSWGGMINYGRGFISSNPALIAVPSAFMLLTILSLNLLADRFLGGRAGNTGGGR